MPLYEFQCRDCKHTVEFLLGMGEEKRKCPECGALKLERTPSRAHHHDTYSPMHPNRGRGHGGAGRIDPGEGMKDFGVNF